jgi:uncharacterized protein (DUF302 family)
MEMQPELSFEVELSQSYDRVIGMATEALKVEGFGVLTTIDVKATLKEKIGEDFRPYVILGACNPHLAHRALSRHGQVGVLLPCNVTVEKTDSGSRVQIINPHQMLAMGARDGERANHRCLGL